MATLIKLLMQLAKWLGFGMKSPVSTDHETTIELVPEVPPEAPKPPSNSDILYDYAYSVLGVDMAPLNDNLGCAESLSYVMRGAGVPNMPIFVGTPELDTWLSKHLKRVDVPEPGDVIMSPTGKGNGKARGHCGIVGKKSIMSNNSRSGKWDYQWTLKEWEDYYGKYAGLPIHFYRWV